MREAAEWCLPHGCVRKLMKGEIREINWQDEQENEKGVRTALCVWKG